jgi:hypothetical protein
VAAAALRALRQEATNATVDAHLLGRPAPTTPVEPSPATAGHRSARAGQTLILHG